MREDTPKLLEKLKHCVAQNPRRLTQNQIANKLGYSPSALSRILNGDRKINLEFILNFCEILELNGGCKDNILKLAGYGSLLNSSTKTDVADNGSQMPHDPVGEKTSDAPSLTSDAPSLTSDAPSLSKEERSFLRQFLTSKFDILELREILFDLGVDYQLMENSPKGVFCRNIISYFERRDSLLELLLEILKRRNDESIRQIATKFSKVNKRKKVHIILTVELIKDKTKLIEYIANHLDISTEEVDIVAAIKGSLHLIVSLPDDSADKLVKEGLTELSGGRYDISSIESFDDLDPDLKNRFKTQYLRGSSYEWPLLVRDEDKEWKEMWSGSSFIELGQFKWHRESIAVLNLPPITKEDVAKLFSRVGTVTSSQIGYFHQNPDEKLVVIQMRSEQQAILAEATFDGYIYQNRKLRIFRPGRLAGEPSTAPSPTDDGGLTPDGKGRPTKTPPIRRREIENLTEIPREKV